MNASGLTIGVKGEINMGELDITSRIKTIELLKSQLLTDLSKLYTNMAVDCHESTENIDLLADIVILTYFLSEKMGTSYTGLDIKIRNKLKLALLEENDSWKTELSLLMRYFNNNK